MPANPNTSSANPISQAEFLATRAMLSEVLDYMLRLPANPMTVEMARKVRDHLASPAQMLEVERSREAAIASGVAYGPSGVPVVGVEVSGANAWVWTPFAHLPENQDAYVLERLRPVIQVPLEPRRAPQFSGAPQGLF